MVEWFRERYISRDEHQNIVAYYRKLVAHLQGNIRGLREQVEAQGSTDVTAGEEAEEKPLATVPVQISAGHNVVRLDFRRRR